MKQKNNLTRWQRAYSWGKGTLNLCRFACRYPTRPANRQPTQTQGAFHVTSISNTETVEQQRAEPLARPCSFALLHRLSGGTRSGRWIGATVGVHTLLQLYPHLSTPHTTSSCSNSGHAPLNKCTLSSKTASWVWWSIDQGCAYRGNRSTRHRQKMNGGRKPQSAPTNSNIPLILSCLGVRGVLCPSLTNKQITVQ